jgi:hypothetical protein
MTSPAPPSTTPARPLWALPGLWAGLVLAVGVRFATRPRSFWEHDELLFALAVDEFSPLSHHPHPPGYPLLVALGKLFALLAGEPFAALVALAVVSTAVSFPALLDAFRRLAAPLGPAADRVALTGALLFHLSPAMLVQGPLPMSDPPALAFLSLSLAAAARLGQPGQLGRRPAARTAIALGLFAAAAVGCRPQLVVPVLPFLLAAVAPAAARGRRALVAAAFAAAVAAWLVPLVDATGGPRGFVDYQLGHADTIAEHEHAAWRAHWPTPRLAARFVAHPWGTRTTALPVLALAAAGAVALARRRATAALPLAALAATQLLFCLIALEPADGVRYSLPAQLAVAGAAAAGAAVAAERLRRPWLAPAAVAALAVAGALYAGPLLAARATGPSPPAAAARFVREELPADSALLVAKTLLPHAAVLLGDRERVRVEADLELFAGEPWRHVWLLAEGESSWPGARTFSWPASDAYGKLTRAHYRTVSLSPVPPERRFLARSGVHPYEPNGPDGWWWLSDRAVIELAPRGRSRLRLELRLPPVLPFASNRIALALDGEPAAEVEVPRGESRELVLPLPNRRRVELALTAAAGLVPAEAGLNPLDRRRVAVQLCELELLP